MPGLSRLQWNNTQSWRPTREKQTGLTWDRVVRAEELESSENDSKSLSDQQQDLLLVVFGSTVLRGTSWNSSVLRRVRVVCLLAPHGVTRIKSGKISTHLTTAYWKLSSTVWSGLNAPLLLMKLFHATEVTQNSHSTNNNVLESEFWVTLPGSRIWNRESR